MEPGSPGSREGQREYEKQLAKESDEAKSAGDAEAPELRSLEQEPAELQGLGDFDMQYFHELEGPDGWSAIGQENCTNQRYFTALDVEGEKLGIVGVYDTEDSTNLTHTVVDPKYRGQGLAAEMKHQLIEKLDLPFITMTINLGNTSSTRATEKLPGVKRVSDEQYERDFGKAKYIYESPKESSEE